MYTPFFNYYRLNIMRYFITGSHIFIVVSTTRFKLHPFLGAAYCSHSFGLLSGMPLAIIIASGTMALESTVGSLGIVIVIAAYSTFLEEWRSLCYCP